MKANFTTIAAYNRGQTKGDKAVCDLLKREIDKALPKAESKIWHGAPVWFLDGNPVVGYHKQKAGVVLLFWSGQSFGLPGLAKEGSFKAAEATYVDAKDVKLAPLRRWLAASKKIQWNYRDIMKNKGLKKLK